MGGTQAGGMKAYRKNISKDPKFYQKIGKRGGSVRRPESRMFYLDRELAARAGAKGGKKGKKGPSIKVKDFYEFSSVDLPETAWNRLRRKVKW